MKLVDAVNAAYQRKWSVQNNFTVQFILKGRVSSMLQEFTDDINLSIVSIKTPDITNSGIEQFIGGEWRIHNGHDNLFKFSITFRDYNQMELYNRFIKLYTLTKIHYFDDVAIDVILNKDPDWIEEDSIIIMRLEDCLIEGISNLDFSNTAEAEIAEFSVEFKCVNPHF